MGIEVSQKNDGIFICQAKYAKDFLKRFKMLNCNPTSTPIATGLKLSKEENGTKVYLSFFKRLVVKLMYLTPTRPDIMYAVNLISRFMETPMDSHWQTEKMILRYISGTRDYGILYSKSDDFILVGYTDSDFAGSINDRKSTSGYIFHLGSGAISWASQKQPIVTLSTTEAEYVAATSTACQAVRIRRIMTDLMQDQEGATQIYCDNNSTIKLSKHNVFHKISKNIDTRYHFI